MVPWCRFGGPWGSLGGPQGVPGVLGEGPKGTENTKGSLGASGGCPGGPLGRFWSFGVVLGSSPGVANVNISLVLMMFLEVRCFRCFFVTFLCDFFFEDMKNRVVFSSDFGMSTCWYFFGFNDYL